MDRTRGYPGWRKGSRRVLVGRGRRVANKDRGNGARLDDERVAGHQLTIFFLCKGCRRFPHLPPPFPCRRRLPRPTSPSRLPRNLIKGPRVPLVPQVDVRPNLPATTRYHSRSRERCEWRRRPSEGLDRRARSEGQESRARRRDKVRDEERRQLQGRVLPRSRAGHALLPLRGCVVSGASDASGRVRVGSDGCSPSRTTGQT